MRSLRSFILQINPQLLQTFFDYLLIGYKPLPIRWDQPLEPLIASVQQAVDHLPTELGLHVQNEVNRVGRLTHTYAQQCLSKLMGQCDQIGGLASSYERSCYTYIHESHHFQAVEALHNRRPDHDSQWWGQYVIGSCVGDLSINTETCQAFRAYLAERLLTTIENIILYPAESTRGHCAEIFMDIYHRANPEKHLYFSQGNIASAEHDTIDHYKLAYCRNTRLIEVQAPEISKQNLIAYSFAHVFFNVDTVAMRPMTLEPFRHKERLQWDEEDDIATLGFGRMTIEDIYTRYSACHQFSPGASDPESIEQYFDCSYRGFNPARSDQFRLTEVLLKIYLKNQGYLGQPASIALSLALPNQRNLRNHSLKHQHLGESLLLRWGVLNRLAS